MPKEANTIGEYVDLIRRADAAGDAAQDLNADALARHLDDGWIASSAVPLPDGMGPWRQPMLLMLIRRGDESHALPVGLGPAGRRLLGRLADVPLEGAPRAGSDASRAMRPQQEVIALLSDSGAESSADRATRLLDWVLERLDATRCVLIPFVGGTPGLPLAARVRGHGTRDLGLRRLPRAILGHVASTRQPLMSNDVSMSGDELPASTTLAHQAIRSYMAVPVVFRSDLLAVFYVDRVAEPRDFTADERAAFEAVAYELAMPLLDLLEARRREEYRRLRDHRLSDEASAQATTDGPAMAAMRERARHLGRRADQNMLLLGETGVGKEHLARDVHAHSPRAEGPFVAVNLAVLPSELFESELFGSLRGAFTGASDRTGWIERAEGGTLFLDELGDLPLLAQVKLLRFLQDRVVAPLGSTKSRRADVRVIAATNRPLHDLVASGEFRADLLHRFAPAIVIPPLRERPDEILPLAEGFLAAQARATGSSLPVLDDSAKARLLAEPWPGNVRQLESVVAHAAILSRAGRIDAGVLDELLVERHAGAAPPARSMQERPRTWNEWIERRDALDREMLQHALDEAGGVPQFAARNLEIAPSSLRYLLSKHGIGGDARKKC